MPKFTINWLHGSWANADSPRLGGCDFAGARDKQINPNCPEDSKLSRLINKDSGYGHEMYDDALAAFMAFGDCPLARKFLKHGAKANRLILARILASPKIPSASFQHAIGARND
jgi:hypothetical protein